MHSNYLLIFNESPLYILLVKNHFTNTILYFNFEIIRQTSIFVSVQQSLGNVLSGKQTIFKYNHDKFFYPSTNPNR